MDESRLWADSDPTLCERDPFHNELNEGNFVLGLGTFMLAKVVKMDRILFARMASSATVKLSFICIISFQ